ncbi:MAG: hypothetical protein HC855_16835 [Rhizobiales bacterium]|nr:hypothetical protein [Hyphomicrobiales bacterium]
MPLQNRVHPSGELFAVPERGTMLGNRGGKFHRGDRTLGKRRWATHHWIACELHYKGMHHEAMGKGYTSLFFLDEVTALAAGHRPCFFCRRAEAKRFMELAGMETDAFDRELHQQRVGPSSWPTPGAIGSSPKSGDGAMDSGFRQNDGRGLGELPDGAMVEIDGEPYAVKGARLLRWSFAGYANAIPRNSSMQAKVLTPPLIVAILAKGYQPRWHLSAHKGSDT